MESERMENFSVDQQTRRKSQRRSSILKIGKVFDDIQNTTHDDRFSKDRRVSFANNVEVKEYKKGSSALETDKKSRKVKIANSVHISTPKGTTVIPSDRLSIDRLSIIPKFEKSILEDSEDFEPYVDEALAPGVLASVEPPKPVPNLDSEHPDIDEELASLPVTGVYSISSEKVTDPFPQPPLPNIIQQMNSPLDGAPPTNSTTYNQSDMALTQVESPKQQGCHQLSPQAFLVVPEITSMNKCPISFPVSKENDDDTTAPPDTEGRTVLNGTSAPMSFTTIVDQTVEKDITLENNCAAEKSTVEDPGVIQNEQGNATSEEMEVDVEFFSAENRKGKKSLSDTKGDSADTELGKEKSLDKKKDLAGAGPVEKSDVNTVADMSVNNSKGTTSPTTKSAKKSKSKPPRPKMKTTIAGTTNASKKTTLSTMKSEDATEVSAISKFSISALLQSSSQKQKASPKPVHIPHNTGRMRGTPGTAAVSTPLNKRASFVSRFTPTVYTNPTHNLAESVPTDDPTNQSNHQEAEMEMAHSCIEGILDNVPSSVDVHSTTVGPNTDLSKRSQSHGAATEEKSLKEAVKEDQLNEQDQSKNSNDLESVSSLSGPDSNTSVTPPLTTIENSVSSDPVMLSSNAVAQSHSNEAGNWFESKDTSFNLLESSNDSPGLAETTYVKETESPPIAVPSAKRRKLPSRQKKSRSLRVSLLHNLKAQSESEEVGGAMDVETPEMVPVDCPKVGMQIQSSIFSSPELTVLDETTRHHNRQSLMMSPSGFTKFLVNLNCDKTLVDQSVNEEMEVSPGAHVEVPTVQEEEMEEETLNEKPKDDGSQDISSANLAGKRVESLTQLDVPDVTPSFSIPNLPLHDDHSVYTPSSTSPVDNTCLEATYPSSTLPQAPHLLPQSSDAVPQDSDKLPSSAPPEVVYSYLPSSPTPSDTICSPMSSDFLSSPLCSPTVQPEQDVYPSTALLSQPLSQGETSNKDIQNLESSASLSVSSDVFIAHVHSLRSRFISIARSSQARLASSEYITCQQLLFKQLLESIITRANIALSVLTLFISYGDISGLGKTKISIPPIPEMPISEHKTEEKFQWMKEMHNELQQKWSDVVFTMVSAAELYHWKVDLWNRSKIVIVIDNSAKITFTLEDISLSVYPQRIVKTKVQYVRGSLLYSKPQTNACTTTADIVQLLWTIIKHRGSS